MYKPIPPGPPNRRDHVQSPKERRNDSTKPAPPPRVGKLDGELPEGYEDPPELRKPGFYPIESNGNDDE
jgi:hypothetical protein